MNCLLCDKPFEKKGSKIHDLAWDSKAKSFRKDENGNPKTYVINIHRDCYWERYNASKATEGSVA